jgi:hypothetical protein
LITLDLSVSILPICGNSSFSLLLCDFCVCAVRYECTWMSRIDRMNLGCCC